MLHQPSPEMHVSVRRMASASRDPAAAPPCFHRCCSLLSSAFKSTVSPGGNLPASAPPSSKLLDLSLEIRDPSRSQPAQLAAKQAPRGHVTQRSRCTGGSWHRTASRGLPQQSPERSSPLQPCPFLSGQSCFPSRFAAIPAGSLANTSTTNTEDTHRTVSFRVRVIHKPEGLQHTHRFDQMELSIQDILNTRANSGCVSPV